MDAEALDYSVTYTSESPSHAVLMDRIYRSQRHIYDITRKYYLFGRDRLIDRMPVAPNDRVIEIGCGTGRNLMRLAHKHPQARFFGLDAANVMIDTAAQKVARAGLESRISLLRGLAENLDARTWFDQGLFDSAFFSYSLSMIPTWPAALNAALANLRPSGEIWVVDFWDQSGYPAPFAALLKRRALFHVHHRPELLEHLQQLHADGQVKLTIEPIGRRYAYLARLVKCG